MNPSRLVQRIHFEDFGGTEFERLVFAYHVRAAWTDLAWYGQSGTDKGRDIIGTEHLDAAPPRFTVIQCANRTTLTKKKTEADMKAAVAALGKTPDAFKFITRGNVSPARRDAIDKAAKTLGIQHVTVWSGAEFEENLRLRAEDLLKRFCAGEPFPDSGDDIQRFVDDFAGLTDDEILHIMAAVFERPAFRTRFQQESSLPAFLQAIEDTIGALNTGIWRTREGHEVRRIPSQHHLRDPVVQAKVQKTTRILDELRRRFVAGLRDGTICPCSCKQPDCPVFTLDHGVDEELDLLRSRALASFRDAYSAFEVHLD